MKLTVVEGWPRRAGEGDMDRLVGDMEKGDEVDAGRDDVISLKCLEIQKCIFTSRTQT